MHRAQKRRLEQMNHQQSAADPDADEERPPNPAVPSNIEHLRINHDEWLSSQKSSSFTSPAGIPAHGEMTNNRLRPFISLLNVLVIPSILFGMIPKRLKDFLEDPTSIDERRIKSFWYWFSEPTQLLYTICWEVVFWTSFITGLYLVVKEEQDETPTTPHNSGWINDFVFLFNYCVITIGALCCIYAWALYSTPKFAEAWLMFARSTESMNLGLMAYSGTEEDKKSQGIVGLWAMALISFIVCSGVFGLELYSAMLPYLDNLSGPMQNWFLVRLAFGDFTGCWSFIASIIFYKITTEIGKEFQKRFHAALATTMDNSKYAKSEAKPYKYGCWTPEQGEAMGALYTEEIIPKKPLIFVGETADDSESMLEAELENYRLTYITFLRNYESFCEVNRIQLLVAYVFSCCLVVTSSYFSVLSVVNGSVASAGMDLELLSHWLATILNVSLLVYICETGQSMQDEIPSPTHILSRSSLRNMPESVWRQLQALVAEMNAHPIRATIFKGLEINRNLLVAGFTTIATYLIVLIQFKQEATAKQNGSG